MFKGFGALFTLLAFEQFLTRDHNVAALLVQLYDGDFDGLSFHAIEIADRAQVHLRAREKRVSAVDVDREAAFDAVDYDSIDRLFLVVRFFDLFPGMNPLRLLVREADI